MKLFNFGALSVLVIAILGACAASGPAISDSTSAESIFPSWYTIDGFSSDSLIYSGFATAIASDSAVALERAEKQARINLEKNIALLTEEIRTGLVESGSNNADNTDFIIILRTAHSGVETAATLGKSIARNTEGYYRGFASVEITRTQVRNVLEKGFTGHPRYWGEFSSAQGFAVHF
jgi:hypothetical protein